MVAPLTASIYLEAGGEIVWLGRRDSPRHPRAMLAASEPSADGQTLRSTSPSSIRGDRHGPATPTSRRCGAPPATFSPSCAGRAPIASCLRASAVSSPGSGRIFRSTALSTSSREIAAACDRGDAGARMIAAEPLLGLGPGLTPSGDDFIGGVLFARHAVEPPGSAWAQAASTIVARAHDRTHPISAALLEDLAAGEGHEPLHDLVDALARGAIEDAWAAVQRLGRLGHSSGWDMLAGVMVGLAGAAALPALRR